MTAYTHQVSGFFIKRNEAQLALSKLNARGIPKGRLSIYDNVAQANQHSPFSDSKAMLKALLYNGAIGAAVGTALGVLAEIGLVIANFSLFVASPILAPLAMLGWGASLGGVVGAAIGSKGTTESNAKLTELFHNALMNGQVILVATTLNEAETANAKAVIKESAGAFNDTSKR
ncbi:hypothetical protein RQP54_17250 [Curvibacter sp. APW13]|uniref:hypothetical protein n=1 Tax=Curvibacter sp. APW13 TaxID=3077236 RepID=UPI0028DEA0DC|nr:hypothetical protein [Curvibacter sp. APW13]MDT8992622.1 hypothetical protein [Curvibacter sp. APW13]